MFWVESNILKTFQRLLCHKSTFKLKLHYFVIRYLFSYHCKLYAFLPFKLRREKSIFLLNMRNFNSILFFSLLLYYSLTGTQYTLEYEQTFNFKHTWGGLLTILQRINIAFLLYENTVNICVKCLQKHILFTQHCVES